MNKTEMIAAMAEKAGMSKVDAKKALEAFMCTVEGEMKAGNKISLPGFGTFSVKDSPARTGKNPKTGEVIKIAAKKSAKFKAGSNLAL